jgi:hypothetical protein
LRKISRGISCKLQDLNPWSVTRIVHSLSTLQPQLRPQILKNTRYMSTVRSFKFIIGGACDFWIRLVILLCCFNLKETKHQKITQFYWQSYSIFIFLRSFGLGRKWTEQGPYLKRFIVVLCLSIISRSRRKKLPEV